VAHVLNALIGLGSAGFQAAQIKVHIRALLPMADSITYAPQAKRVRDTPNRFTG